MNNSPQLNIDETPAKAPITTLESLREHLQWAIELEHATLPPYLCALYSLDPQRNPDAVQAVSGVFVEEMLHLALAANLLNAVGGQPVLDAPHMLPVHPRALPHGDHSMQLALLPFGPDALEVFLRLEQPALPDAGPEGTITRRSGSSTTRSNRACATSAPSSASRRYSAVTRLDRSRLGLSVTRAGS